MPKFLSYQRPRPVNAGNWAKAPPPAPKAIIRKAAAKTEPALPRTVPTVPDGKIK